MTQEDKELILKDLCAMSFYSVKVTVSITSFVKGQNPYTGPIELVSVNAVDITCTVGNRYAQISGIKILDRKGELVCKPYLRPLSSMTKKEQYRYDILEEEIVYRPGVLTCLNLIDFCNAHHLDYRGLIEKGLALEAPKGMYEY